MKKALFSIVILNAAIVCWNWLLESRSLMSVIGFFAMFLAGVHFMPVEKGENE